MAERGSRAGAMAERTAAALEYRGWSQRLVVKTKQMTGYGKAAQANKVELAHIHSLSVTFSASPGNETVCGNGQISTYSYGFSNTYYPQCGQGAPQKAADQ